jgi:hypothetical protein
MTSIRNDWWRGLIESGGLACVLFLTGCGGSETPKDATSGTTTQAQQGGKGVVDPAKIERCGGFTAEMAAGILGVPVSEIQATNHLEYETLRICSFGVQSDYGKIVSFSLSWEKSAEEAEAGLARTRENLGLAQRSIGAVTGSTDKGPALEEIPGLGDEAFYTRVNDTLVARVGNVTIQVMTAPDLEAYKQIAREVIKGLQ